MALSIVELCQLVANRLIIDDPEITFGHGDRDWQNVIVDVKEGEVVVGSEMKPGKVIYLDEPITSNDEISNGAIVPTYPISLVFGCKSELDFTPEQHQELIKLMRASAAKFVLSLLAEVDEYNRKIFKPITSFRRVDFINLFDANMSGCFLELSLKVATPESVCLPVSEPGTLLCRLISLATAAQIASCMTEEQLSAVCTADCPEALIQLLDTDGELLDEITAPAGVTTPVTAPNGTINLLNTEATQLSVLTVKSAEVKSETAPDGTANAKNSLGTTLKTMLIPAGATKDLNLDDVTNTDSTGELIDTPAGVPFVCTPLDKYVSIDFPFIINADTSGTFTNNSGLDFTLTAESATGTNGTITISINGGAYAAFSNPTTLPNGQTMTVKRTTTTGANSITYTGTHA